MNIEEIKKMAETARGTLDNLKTLNAEILAKLPPEYDDKKTEIYNDLSRIDQLVEKKDINNLSELLKKYANNDSK